MSRSDRSSRVLVLGVLVSAGAHIACMAGFVRLSDGDLRKARPQAPDDANPPDRETLRPPEPPPPEQEHVVHLGIEQSKAAATMTWLGFSEPTPHEARRAVTQQSPFTLKPGESEVAAAPEAAPAPPAMPAAPQAAVPLAPPRVQPQPEPSVRPIVDPALAELGRRMLDQVRRLAKETVNAAAEATIKPAPAVSTPPAPAVAAEPKPPTPGKPGIASDRESIATALKDAPIVRPGQVVACKGLEIATREARWTITTMMTRNPRNAVVSITFGRDGRVRQADFLTEGGRRYSTGYDDVDQPLLNAIFTWTARGEPLRALPAGDPEAGITVILTIVLG